MHSFRVNLVAKSSALTQAKKANEKFLPFVTANHPAVSNLKLTLVEQWSLIQNQPETTYFSPSITSCKRGKSINAY